MPKLPSAPVSATEYVILYSNDTALVGLDRDRWTTVDTRRAANAAAAIRQHIDDNPADGSASYVAVPSSSWRIMDWVETTTKTLVLRRPKPRPALRGNEARLDQPSDDLVDGPARL